MDAMWEARGSAFKVVEERWKTFEKDGEMVSEPGQRRVRDREVETLRKLSELAWFIATETFGVRNLAALAHEWGLETMQLDLP